MGAVTEENVDEIMTYHPPPSEARAAKHKTVNAAAEVFARVLLEQCPECADRSSAIRAVREARMWANSAIALRGLV